MIEAVDNVLNRMYNEFTRATSRDITTSIELEFRVHSWRSSLHSGTHQYDRILTEEEYKHIGIRFKKNGWIRAVPPLMKLNRFVKGNGSRVTEYLHENPVRVVEETKHSISPGDASYAWQSFQYHYHIMPSMSIEKHISEDKLPASTRNGGWTLRQISRVRLIHPQLPNVGIDFSKVICNGVTSYEVEVEIYVSKDHNPIQAADFHVHVLVPILQGIQGVPTKLLPFVEQTIWFGDQWKTNISELRSIFNQISLPQPVALSHIHYNAFHSGEYAVTEKLDGKRMILWLTSSGQWILVNNHFQWIVISDTVVERSSSSLVDSLSICCIDGEYLEKERIFFAFDLYYIVGHGIHQNDPWVFNKPLAQRYKLLEILYKNILEPWIASCTHIHISIQLKPFLWPPSVSPSITLEEYKTQVYHLMRIHEKGEEGAAKVKTVFGDKTDGTGYISDGLIFNTLDPIPSELFLLPSVSSASSNHTNTIVSAMWNVFRWTNGALKWKVPSLTTIDFALG